MRSRASSLYKLSYDNDIDTVGGDNNQQYKSNCVRVDFIQAIGVFRHLQMAMLASSVTRAVLAQACNPVERFLIKQSSSSIQAKMCINYLMVPDPKEPYNYLWLVRG